MTEKNMDTENNKSSKHTVIDSIFLKIVITNILNTTAWVTIADAAIIGNFLGVEAVGAFGMVWPVVFFYGLIGGVIGGGTRNLYAGLIGQGKKKEANSLYTLTLLVTVILSAVIITVTLIFSEQIAVLLGAHGNNARLGPLVAEYLRGFVWEVPFFSLGALISPLIVIDSDFKRPAAARISMSVVDVAADFAVVLFFDESMYLIGFATAIAQMVYFAVLMTHFGRKDNMLGIDLSGICKPFRMMWDVLINGSANVMSSLSNTFGGLAVNHIFSLYVGSIYLSAYSVHKSVTSIFGIFYFGIADAVLTLSRLYYSEEDRRALGRLQKKAIRTGLFISLIVTVGVIVFSSPLARIFIGTDSSEAFVMAKQAVRCFAYSLPLFVLVYSFKNYLLGTGRIMAANVYVFLVEFCSLTAGVWIMVRLFGGSGAWLSTPFRLAVVLLGTYIFIMMCGNGKAFREKRLMLRKDFGVPPDRELYTTIYDLNGLTEAVDMAAAFCEDHAIDAQRAYIVSRCITELGEEVIGNRSGNGRNPSMDIRLILKDGELVLRLRDDGDAFDPTHMFRGSGLTGDVCEMQYLRTVSTNNLIVKVF